MTTDAGERTAKSLLARLISSQSLPWATLGFSLLLILVPAVVAYLDGIRSVGYWRMSLLPAAVITYILVVSPILTRGEARVVEAFRPLVLMDDDGFKRLVNQASRVSASAEALAFGVGAAFGLLAGQSWLSDPDALWLRVYLTVSAGLMFGLLGWVIYAAVAGTRLTRELHRQPLRFDIFDIKRFEPIGRQSLAIALVFVGGMALSIVLGGGLASFSVWQNWVVYPLLAVVPILVFFLNMRDTHRVLSQERRRELEAVQRRMLVACRSLMERLETGERTGTLGPEINALVAYGSRLRAARTWPYDTAMLRTLFLSVVVPGGAAAGRVLSELLLQ